MIPFPFDLLVLGFVGVTALWLAYVLLRVAAALLYDLLSR